LRILDLGNGRQVGSHPPVLTAITLI
jgi:hypothetical protein